MPWIACAGECCASSTVDHVHRRCFGPRLDCACRCTAVPFPCTSLIQCFCHCLLWFHSTAGKGVCSAGCPGAEVQQPRCREGIQGEQATTTYLPSALQALPLFLLGRVTAAAGRTKVGWFLNRLTSKGACPDISCHCIRHCVVIAFIMAQCNPPLCCVTVRQSNSWHTLTSRTPVLPKLSLCAPGARNWSKPRPCRRRGSRGPHRGPESQTSSALSPQ